MFIGLECFVCGFDEVGVFGDFDVGDVFSVFGCCNMCFFFGLCLIGGCRYLYVCCGWIIVMELFFEDDIFVGDVVNVWRGREFFFELD